MTPNARRWSQSATPPGDAPSPIADRRRRVSCPPRIPKGISPAAVFGVPAGAVANPLIPQELQGENGMDVQKLLDEAANEPEGVVVFDLQGNAYFAELFRAEAQDS